MNVPEGVLRSYRPCRAKPQPPSGCNGQCARAAERQSSRVTYSSPASPVSNRSCTGTGPAGMPPARAHLLKAQRQVGELTQSRRPQPRQAAQRSSGHRAPGTGHRRNHPQGTSERRPRPQAVDMRTMRWRAPARPVDNADALPTARAFAHMPTASHHGQIKRPNPKPVPLRIAPPPVDVTRSRAPAGKVR